MKKGKFSLPLILGICLILASLCLLAVLQLRMYRGTQKSKAAATQLLALLPERVPGVAGTDIDPQMPVLEIDGTDYVGLLEIPALDAVVPVADKWEQNMLTSACGRFWGSAYDHTLVIGGPDHPGQFDFCDDIEVGAVVLVTDMTGVQFAYTVSRVDRAKHAERQWLLDTEYDLTIFCRDASSFEYIAVRCVSAVHTVSE